MATSGYITTNEEYGSYFWVSWWVNSQSIENNRTNIGWSCGVYCGHNFYSNAVRMDEVIINGVEVFSGGTYSDFYAGNHTIASGSLNITHNSDGTKTFKINYFSGWLYQGHWYEAGETNYTLKAIPRKSTLTGANGTLGAQQSFTIKKANASFRHSLAYSCGTESGDVSEITDSAYVNWTPPISLAEQSTGSNTVRCAITLTTYNGSTSLGTNTYYFDYIIPEDENTRPSAELTLAPSSELISTFNGLYIQGKTKLSIGFENVTAKYGATASQYRAVVDGKEYTGSSIVSEILSKSGTVTVTAYITDSRGISSLPITGVITVIPYSRPSVVPISGRASVDCFRCDESGVASASGEYLHIRAGRSYSPVSAAGVNKNRCVLQYRHKQADSETYSGWNVLIAKSSLSSDSVDVVIANVVPSALYAYNIQIGVSDDIGETNVLDFSVSSRDVPLQLGWGGKNVGIGRAPNYANDYRIDMGWETHFEKPCYMQDEATFSGDASFAGETSFDQTARFSAPAYFSELYYGGKTLLDLLHPVGSIYISMDDTSPGTLFGGTWEKIKDRFLLADGDSYFAGETGGEKEVTLSIFEMPKHSHSIEGEGGTTGHYEYNAAAEGSAGQSTTLTTSETGSGRAHNNMPPYLVVYIWQRTA